MNSALDIIQCHRLAQIKRALLRLKKRLFKQENFWGTTPINK